jgi:hypothetical protein
MGGISLLLIPRCEGVTTKIIKTSYSSAAGTAYVYFEVRALSTRLPRQREWRCLTAHPSRVESSEHHPHWEGEPVSQSALFCRLFKFRNSDLIEILN